MEESLWTASDESSASVLSIPVAEFEPEKISHLIGATVSLTVRDSRDSADRAPLKSAVGVLLGAQRFHHRESPQDSWPEIMLEGHARPFTLPLGFSGTVDIIEMESRRTWES